MTSSVQSSTRSDSPFTPSEAEAHPVTASQPTPEDVALRQALSRLRPSLAAQIPEACTTASSKVLYLMTHRALAHEVKGLGLKVSLAGGGSIALTRTGGLDIKGAPGQPSARLNNLHEDLANMLDAQLRHHPTSEPLYVKAARLTVEQFLNEAIHAHSYDPTFDGSGRPENRYGFNTFSFATIQQVLASSDSQQRGLECLAAAHVHLYKSMGLVPPELTREQFEHRYTSIHGDTSPSTPRIPAVFNKALRGIPSAAKFTPIEAVKFANELRNDDWAQLTGASKGRYRYKSFASIGEVISHFQGCGGAVHAGWKNGGHHFVLTDGYAKNGKVIVNQDDSLRGDSTPIRDWANTKAHWPHATEYDPDTHAFFWAIVRSSSCQFE